MLTAEIDAENEKQYDMMFEQNIDSKKRYEEAEKELKETNVQRKIEVHAMKEELLDWKQNREVL